ncbi:hypothetical+protein [Methylocapsa aurea]|uniref:hypothetical protein n=1 Tax=Methylocapsa aurea TaxID=663610 RepID=UPI003D188F82
MPGRQFSLIAELPPYTLLVPAADAAGRASGYVTLKNALKAYAVFHIGQGNAATILLSVLQATDVSGSNSKAIAAAPIWSNLDISASSAWTARAAAATYSTDAGVKNKMVAFEILPEAALDMANGFNSIAVSTGASNAANITFAELLIVPRIKAIGSSMPSLLTN